MSVIDWKRTSRRPIASRRSPVVAELVVVSAATFVLAFTLGTGGIGSNEWVDPCRSAPICQ
jgi:hypothetical protein